jgi:hypothetical protein
LQTVPSFSIQPGVIFQLGANLLDYTGSLVTDPLWSQGSISFSLQGAGSPSVALVRYTCQLLRASCCVLLLMFCMLLVAGGRALCAWWPARQRAHQPCGHSRGLLLAVCHSDRCGWSGTGDGGMHCAACACARSVHVPPLLLPLPLPQVAPLLIQIAIPSYSPPLPSASLSPGV